MYHYTWGTIWKNMTGGEVWKFDKRFYTDSDLELKVCANQTRLASFVLLAQSCALLFSRQAMLSG